MNRAFVAGSNGPQSWDPLKFARKDAQDLATCLSAPRCGFDIETPPDGADAFAVRRQLYAAAESCTDSDTFLCYFSGHGLLEHGSLYLLWDETNLDRLLGTALPASAMTEAMSACRAGNKLLILDCCHAGAAVGFRDLPAVSAKDVVTPENHLVLMASDRLQRARELEETSGGFLTQQLCAALSTSFTQAAGDDRRLSLQDTTEWLERQAAEHNRNDPEHAVPIPYLFGQQRGPFFFTAPRDEWSPTVVDVGPHPFAIVPFQWSSPDSEPWVLAIARHPVANRSYREFVAHTGAEEPKGEHFIEGRWRRGFQPWRSEGFDDPLQPVVCVSLSQAADYVEWYAEHSVDHLRALARRWREVRLPTQAEWDVAAFGTQHPSRDPRAWIESSPSLHQSADGPAVIDDTGSRTNRFGVSDMVGNVWEWCVDSAGDPHTLSAPSLMMDDTRWVRPGEHAWQGTAALRGGGFLDDLARTLPFVNEWELQDGRDTHHSDVGFRVAVRVPLFGLEGDITERIEACDLHASAPPSMQMPPTA